VGAVVSRLEVGEQGEVGGYIGMLAVNKLYRRRGIGRRLMTAALAAFTKEGAKQVTLETETTNEASQTLYLGLGFHIKEVLPHLYSDGTDAYRLVMLLPSER